MNTEQGISIELYFIDGKTDGMVTAEVFNWKGHVLMTPRIQISQALGRPEVRYTGIYILLGEKGDKDTAYIGEAENVSERIRSHDSKKDWWHQAVIITSAANNLNKAHVKYLEARLINEAGRIGKVKLENGNIPAIPTLSEAAKANMESFLDYVFMVLPSLGIEFFRADTRPSSLQTDYSDQADDITCFELTAPKHGLHASAKLKNGEFIVLSGSHARKTWSGKSTHNSCYGQLHTELIN
ncbi:MAG: GIY-YIG nuclease family protein [bacterium]|nr:GIY-YIG nuclease family protein [bacterium]